MFMHVTLKTVDQPHTSVQKVILKGNGIASFPELSVCNYVLTIFIWVTNHREQAEAMRSLRSWFSFQGHVCAFLDLSSLEVPLGAMTLLTCLLEIFKK